jgi:hypothetical protein
MPKERVGPQHHKLRSVSSAIEQLLYTEKVKGLIPLRTTILRVWCSGNMRAFQALVTSSNLVTRSNSRFSVVSGLLHASAISRD